MGIFDKKPLSYEDLNPQEREVIDYHRRNLDAGFAQQNGDGSLTTFMGAVEDLNGKPTYFPTFWNGRVLPLDQARQRAINSGIPFPTYPTYDAALAREQRIHDIMARDIAAFIAKRRKR